MRRNSRRTARRWIQAGLAWVMVVTLLQVGGQTPAAAAGGPSVPLPDVDSVPVQQQTMGPIEPDQAGSRALKGDQPAGGTVREGAGTPTATSLAASSSWQVSAQTGDFSWSYPLRVPPAPGGLAPTLALSYRSSAVDGRTSATNNQASWVGDGWDLNLGFVERQYGSCSEDKEGSNPGQQTGDLCWRSDNATAAYGTAGGLLIKDAASGEWRPKTDDGARVERLGGVANGDNDGENWKITTVDGTQYFYGSRPDSGSTWTVPVFGDDEDEPCHRLAGFDSSHCVQAYRWNLDKVVDRHGNMMVLDYDTETNSYGFNAKDTAVGYVRGGTLRQIEYGLRVDQAVPATGRVLFGTDDRCVAESTCTFDKVANWPDTALDQRCVEASCKGKYSPTFWSTQRLVSVITQVRRSTGYDDVDRWTLEQSFPDPGDGEKAALWLRSIKHTGLAGNGQEVSLPAVTFAGTQKPNRVYQADGLSPLIRYRISGIISESGGVVSVNYAPADCTAPPTEAHTNTKRCFPVRWARPNHAERTDYFHKYVVETVASSDRISSNATQLVSYEYLGGAAWHYDQSEFTPPDKKTWNEFRGFGKVRIRSGRAADPGGPVTMTEQRFFRGMNGDKLPGNGSRTISVEDSAGGTHPDHDWLQGSGLEVSTHLGETESVVEKTITTPVWQGPTAVRGEYKAYLTRPGTVRTFTALDGGRGWRTTKTQTAYDDRGLATQVDDLGDLATSSDDRCTRTTYGRNVDRWLLNLPTRIETVAVGCASTPVFPRDALADVRTSFDGQAAGAVPVTGSVTKVEQLAERPATGPVYVTAGTARYDVHGRVVESTNALGKATTAVYTPKVGGPTTQVVATNAVGHVSTTTLEPAFGAPLTVVDPNGKLTESSYDALGRLVETWLPNRPRSTYSAGNTRFSYQVNRDAPTVVVETKVGPNGNFASSNTLYDGLLRPRQVQSPAPGGGRLLTDTRYDSQGRVYKSTQPYYNDAPVDTQLWVASDVEVAGLTTTEYDGAGRQTVTAFKGGATEQWHTTTEYGGDRTYTTPPTGGTASVAIVDGRGQAIELRQYRTPDPVGDQYEATKYSYTATGELATLTDPAGNRWEYQYDLRGRRVRTDDPDKGVSTSTYDDAGQLISRTDSRQQTVTYTYDDLGRKTADHVLTGSTSTKRASWSYDILPNGQAAKGQKVSATSYGANGKAYTSSVLAFTALYQPLSTSITVPTDGAAGENALAGTYRTTMKYNFDGSLASETYPQIGDLFGETVSHTYDDSGRPLATAGGPTGSTVDYVSRTDYTRYGEVQRIHLGAGTKRAWVSWYYDDHNRQVERTIVDAELPRPMQADTHYTRDAAGNITSIADTPQEQPADVQCFRYDHLRRLTAAWTPGTGCDEAPSTATLSGPQPYWHTWSYDAVGNRLSETQHGAGGDSVRSYTYPLAKADQPHAAASVTTTGPGGTRTEDFSYDVAGNTVARGNQQLSWDAEGRLASVTEAGLRTEAFYDADGSRLIRRDPSGSTLSLGGQEIRLDKASGQLTATRYYGHGGETVAVRTAAGVSWLASDHQQTLQIAIDAESLTATKRRQLPFGAPRGPAAFPGEKGFVGGTIDATTGLTQVGARPYDPVDGRFLAADPLINPADPQHLHAYAYAGNNPVTFSDPSGQASIFQLLATLLQLAALLKNTTGGAGEPSDGGPGSNDLHPKDYSTKHNAVQRAAANRIVQQAHDLNFQNVRIEEGVYIPGASKKSCADRDWQHISGCTQHGWADIVLTVTVCPKTGTCHDQHYVWEVKALAQDTGGHRASDEADWYARRLSDTGTREDPVYAQKGWDIGGDYGGVPGFPKTRYWGGMKGAVIYGDNDKKRVRNHVGKMKEQGRLTKFDAGGDLWKSYRQDAPSAGGDAGGADEPAGPGMRVPIVPIMPFPARVPPYIVLPRILVR